MNPSETSIEAKVSMETSATELPEDPPFHILVLGDFSGRRNEGKSLKLRQIDRDDFSDVLKQVSPAVRIRTEDSDGFGISFTSLDDFHPDKLFGGLAIFDELRDVRNRLLDEDSFPSAAAEVRGWFESDSDKPKAAASPTVEPPAEIESGNLLDDILSGRSRDAAAYKAQKTTYLKEFVKNVVDPYLVKIDETEQSKLVAAVDGAISGVMRKILQNKEFRALESAWRGLQLMCRRIETSVDLKMFVADISKEEMLERLKEPTGEFNTLLLGGAEANGNEPWAVVIAAYDFDLTVDDIAGLIRVGGIVGSEATPFVSHIRPGMLGIKSFAEKREWDTESGSAERKLWLALRGSEDADSLGLVTPRLMARLPYGEETDATEVFSFEEFDGTPGHDDYLWMNPVFGFGVVIGQTFSKFGWESGGRYELDISGLPVHVYKDDTGTQATKPCAEIEMTDVGLQSLLEEGLMPFASFKNSDRVRLGGIQSVRFPLSALRCRWR